MKTSRFRHSYRENSSRLHRKVGEILRAPAGYFSGYKIYQEYPVQKVNPDWHSGRHHFDWVILDLRVIIEVHGEQHYKPVCFGGISEEEAEAKLTQQQMSDAAKREAALDAGWAYVAIPWDMVDRLTSGFLVDLIEASERRPPHVEDRHEQLLEIQRAHRRQQYQRARELKKQWQE
jgi:hypothetical protein